jgi:O-antigen/teichoic acid export membrane protein
MTRLKFPYLNLQRYRSIGAEGLWIIAGQIACVIGSLALVQTLTGRIAPSAYGELALGLTIAGLINQMVTGSVSNGILRYWSIAEERSAYHVYIAASGRMMLIALCVILTIGAFMIVALLLLDLKKWLDLLLAAISFSVLAGLNAAMNGIQTAARQRSIVAMHSAADAWMKVVLSVGLVLCFGPNSATVVWSYTVSCGLVCLSQIIFLRRLLKRRLNSGGATHGGSTYDWMKLMWVYSWPFAGWGFFTWMQTSSDRWSLQIFSDSAAVGQYSVLYQLSFAPLTLASGLLITLVTPIIFQRAGDARDEDRIEQVFRMTARIACGMLILSVLAAMIFAVLHDWIFRLFAAPPYAAAASLMPLMALSAGLQSVHHVLGIRISSLLMTRSILLPQIASALLFSAINSIGAYLGGLNGLAIAMVAGSLCYACWMWLLSEILRNAGSRCGA